MFADPRRIAVAFCAIGAFLHLYAPQAVLPMMAREYGVGAADASLIITAGTLAVAATAPFTGALSDVLGRKRVIVAAMALLLDPGDHDGAGADACNQLIFWRFVHGLLLPPIFAVTIAYIGDELPPAEANGVFGIYASASAVGGFLGRFIPGMLTEYVGWRGGFLALAGCSVICLVDGGRCCSRRSGSSSAPAISAPRCGRCWRTCATRGCSRPTRSASACCSTSSPPSPI